MKKFIILLAIISCQGLICAQMDTTRTIQVFEDELGNKIEGFIICEDNENLTIKGTDSLIYTVSKKIIEKQNAALNGTDPSKQKLILQFSYGLGSGGFDLFNNHEDISFIRDYGQKDLITNFTLDMNISDFLLSFEYEEGMDPILCFFCNPVVIINQFSFMVGYSFSSKNGSLNFYGGFTNGNIISYKIFSQYYHNYSLAGFKFKTDLLLNIFQWFSIGLYASDIINTDFNFYDAGALFKINIKLR